MVTAMASRSSVTVQPLDDRVLIERDHAEETTYGGIVLPDNAKEKVNRGTVIAVGPGKYNDRGDRIPMTVKVGDKVLISKYGGDDIHVGEDEDVEHVMLRESDILAVCV